MPFGIPSEDFRGGFGLYIVDAKTGENRGPVVMDPWDDISAEEVYPNNHCGECPVWLADAEGGAECDACICNEVTEDAESEENCKNCANRMKCLYDCDGRCLNCDYYNETRGCTAGEG